MQLLLPFWFRSWLYERNRVPERLKRDALLDVPFVVACIRPEIKVLLKIHGLKLLILLLVLLVWV